MKESERRRIILYVTILVALGVGLVWGIANCGC